MGKIKNFFKKYLLGFTLGLISGSLVMVYAQTYFPSNQTTYDNSTSGMAATNVQGAIDELYNVCFPPKTGGDAILDDVDIVTSGDGLYQDEYENCRYLYKGANPNNYITFNDELAGWRIISVECDGTIKIMKTDSIGNLRWDDTSNSWTNSAYLNTYLNSTYYNELNNVSQSKIISHAFGVGAVTYGSNDLAEQINEENDTIWNGKIGLVTASEYIRTNSNINCNTAYLNDWNYNICKNTNWMYTSSFNWWTLSTVSFNSVKFFCNVPIVSLAFPIDAFTSAVIFSRSSSCSVSNVSNF